MRVNFKKITLFIAIACLLVYFGYKYISNIGSRDIESEIPEFTINSTVLAEEYVQNVATSDKKYLNKTIVIKGIVTATNANSVTIDDAVFCQLISKQNIKDKQQLSIKGRVTGYDDLFEQVKLDQCSIIKQ